MTGQKWHANEAQMRTFETELRKNLHWIPKALQERFYFHVLRRILFQSFSQIILIAYRFGWRNIPQWKA